MVSILNYKACHIPFKYGCQVKKSDYIRLTYLKHYVVQVANKMSEMPGRHVGKTTATCSACDFRILPHFFNNFNLGNLQVAYERLLINDRVPAFPLVPIVYTVYRFKQLARAMEIVNAMGGGFSLAFTIRLLMVVWTFYLGLRLTQLPWLYSTWNSNRAT